MKNKKFLVLGILAVIAIIALFVLNPFSSTNKTTNPDDVAGQEWFATYGQINIDSIQGWMDYMKTNNWSSATLNDAIYQIYSAMKRDDGKNDKGIDFSSISSWQGLRQFYADNGVLDTFL